jgi:hypothetical protein
VCFPKGSNERYWRRLTKAQGVMFEVQRARATAKSHLTPATTRHFDVALHSAATSSIESMTALHSAVCDCVKVLKDRNVGPVDMILAMKTCALDSAARYPADRDELPASSVDVLLDQIVKWAIAEYYLTRS